MDSGSKHCFKTLNLVKQPFNSGPPLFCLRYFLTDLYKIVNISRSQNARWFCLWIILQYLKKANLDIEWEGVEGHRTDEGDPRRH